MRLEGAVVAITGASSGIGEATALLLAERGARLVLGARRTERLEALAARIGPAAQVAATDVRRRGDLTALVGLATSRFGRLDAFVANAGIGPVSPLDALLVEEWEAMVDVNIKGLLWSIAAALPVFRAQGSGHLVALASTAGLKTVPTQAVYSATKMAVRALCEGLRQEAGPTLRTTLITPGAVGTDFVDTVSDPALRASMAAYKDIGLGPAVVAQAIAYALEQPPEVDVGEIVLRPTAQA